MPDHKDLLEYHKSITKEIEALQNRVRSLIRHEEAKGTNWGEDGRYKEAILRDLIKKSITDKYKVGTGFVVDKNVVSSQIDILIIEKELLPPLFEKDDFIITTPLNVQAIIEVKTILKLSNNQKIEEVFETATQNGKILRRGMEPFNSIFSFESPTDVDIKEKSLKFLKDALQESKGIVSPISLGKNLFIEYFDRSPVATETIKNFYRIYQVEDVSFSYFLFSLIEYLYPNSKGRDWFLKSIFSTKTKIYDIPITRSLVS